jgi:hypothetical protein
MRGIGFAGFDHIRVGDRRKWHVAGIFERWRRRIGNRNIGRRKRRDIARWNARLGRGRFGNLLRMVGGKLFQMRVLSAGAARGTTAHGSTVAFADEETS